MDLEPNNHALQLREIWGGAFFLATVAIEKWSVACMMRLIGSSAARERGSVCSFLLCEDMGIWHCKRIVLIPPTL